ncbi:isoleucine--tRNA ligase [Meiothermus sp. CFH 77666]|uniref:isoleucine--tRNA ligase n=1 Tax=Meiothermus sp. CFH 77666 TaxID=2817942 RepID=UPI001AA081DB|nr:isoleucine--tRNA ligase [Meiothermus sp. CFH 77666]MBO1435782.1 isoleucine--tRNA ligase [Meiothermus sp. CFH 77666]
MVEEKKLFEEVSETNFPKLEEAVLAFWREQQIFAKSDRKPAPKGEFVFYEGPPTANGKPAMHHVLARSFKDIFPRYKTMQGYHVTRKGGWDTHGLPVEIAVEKKLGVLGRKTLNREQIAEFTQQCREWVFANIEDWNYFTERMGMWVDLENAYITYHNSYIESVWNLLKRMWDRGMVVQDYKVVPLSPRISTTLSQNEIADGYREVDDPSVYVRFPLKLETAPQAVLERLKAQGVRLENLDNLAILVWTTTPWTLPSNTMAAVNPEMDYAVVRSPSVGHLIFAAEAVERLRELHKEELEVVAHLKGKDLEWWEYTPPFPEVGVELGVVKEQGEKRPDGRPVMHFVALADFVSAEDGSGVAHEAPVYGAEDLELSRQYGTPLLFGTNEYGLMQVTDERGKFFKDADKGLIRIMKERGVLYHAGQIRHRYPFHDRTGDPILYFAKPSWYIKTSNFRQALYDNNEKINWFPEHIKHGRFGNWLKDNVDWAISRERYWGTPLPFWVSEDGSEKICVGSVRELSELAGRDLSDLDLHRPYVDEITFVKNGKTFRRVPEVLDVWFDSGAMPYAQWHLLLDEQGQPLPGTEENYQLWQRHFPADYICEAIDQTRGWFYSLHAISTLLYDQPCFKNVICLGHLVDEKGHKMSKSKGNVVEPLPMFDKYGADAVRWYLFTGSEPGEQKRFSERLVQEAQRGFLGTLWNVYSFFVLYANLDRPNLQNRPAVADRPEMDRWLAARQQQLIERVTARLDAYDARGAGKELEQFVEELSNWYVRRNRRRFWKNDDPTDRESAYATLWEALVTVAQLAAPFTPFVAEALWQNLMRKVQPEASESVHLSDWPKADPALIDQTLLTQMGAVVKVVGLARSARAISGVKTRMPLPRVLVTAPTEAELAGLRHFADEIAEELNVKQVEVLGLGEELLTYRVLPNLPVMGKKYGKLVPAIRAALAELDSKMVARTIKAGQSVTLEVRAADGTLISLSPEELLLEALSPEGYSAQEQDGYLAALEVKLDEQLLLEGLSRDLIRLVQQARKEMGLNVSDRIHLTYTAEGRYAESLVQFGQRLQEETLALSLVQTAPVGYVTELSDEEGAVKFGLRKA